MDKRAATHGPEWANHDAAWWIGQATALSITVGLLWHGGYSGPAAAAVGYGLAVLVDIRELVQKRGE